MKFSSKTEAETKALAKRFVSSLSCGATVGLIGELGAGKTAFAKGIAEALGIKQRITSPTFVVMRVYETKKHPAIRRLVHVDAYRIQKARSLEAIGLKDYINDKESLVVIEWADLVENILPASRKLIRFSHSKDGRTINLGSVKAAPDTKARPRRPESTHPRG